MRSRTRLFRFIVALGSVTAVSVAEGQTCIGLPRNSVAPVNLGARITFPDGANDFNARLGFGGPNGFGGISVGFTDYDALSKNSLNVGGDVGYSVPVNSRRTTTMCPLVQLNYQNGPNTPTVDRNGLGLLAGVALGGEVEAADDFVLVPHVSAGVLYRRVKSTTGTDSESASETGGQIGAGLSFQFNRIFNITPSVTFPVGFEGNTDPVFAIGMSLGFRRR